MTGGALSLVRAAPEGSDVVDSGALLSESGVEYPITEGVPVLVRQDQFAEGQKETVDSFSWKWTQAKNYRDTINAYYTQWYLDRYGFKTEASLAKFLEGKKTTLDAGTAHGRDAEMYSRNSSATIFGIDISQGVARPSKAESTRR